MNKLVLCGRLTRDPETRVGNGTTVTRYTLAVDRRFKKEGEPDADFFNCTTFGKAAEFADKYFKQGTKVIVVGRMESDNYTNKDGQKVYGWRVVVDEQEFAESKTAAQGDKPEPRKDDYVKVDPALEEDLPFI